MQFRHLLSKLPCSCFASAAVPAPAVPQQPLPAPVDGDFPHLLADFHHPHHFI